MFSGAVAEMSEGVRAGDTVGVLACDQSWLGRGTANPQSDVRVRILAWDPKETLDDAWLKERLQRAWNWRKAWDIPRETTAMRIVNGEGDGLPGLIVDRYDDCVVIQPTGVATGAVYSEFIIDRRLLVGYSPELRRCVHLNPVRAGIVPHPADHHNAGPDVALYLARRHAALPLEVLGAHYGGLGPSGVTMACRRVAQQMDHDRRLRRRIQDQSSEFSTEVPDRG